MAKQILQTAIVYFVLPSVLAAAPVLIDFEGYSDGHYVDEEYSASGVHFLNDYRAHTAYFSARPTIRNAPVAWSAGKVLVNGYYNTEFWNSAHVPMVVYFDQTAMQVDLKVGRLSPLAPSAHVALFDANGSLRAEKNVTLVDNAMVPVSLNDPAGTAQLLVIDYGASGQTAEVIDDLMITEGTGAPAVDTTSPQVQITSHHDNQIVNSSPILMHGEITENSGVIPLFKINGVSGGATPFSNVPAGSPPRYEFWFSKTLVYGANPITAMAWDRAGNTGSHSIIVHYGPPATVQMTQFHLTQRGIMKNQAYDVDGPFVAGKFTIVRIHLDARTAGGNPSYVSSVKMTLYRKTSGADQEVAQYWGTQYSPMVAGFDAPSQMTGIHFYIPEWQSPDPGDYRMAFQAYVGLNPVGAVMTPANPNPYFRFHEMKPIKLFILPTEAPLLSPLLGPDHTESVMRTFDFMTRAYPIAGKYPASNPGLRWVIAPPLPLGDGTAAMDAAQEYIHGTGFTWTFKDADPTGIWRASHEIVWNAPNDPLAGRITTTTLVNLASQSVYGFYRPGGFPGGWNPHLYNFPFDDNHNGTIDDDFTNYAAEFQLPGGSWSTDFGQYQHGLTFRSYVDNNRNNKHDNGEPYAPIAHRGRNAIDNLIFGPAQAAMNAYNNSLGSGAVKCTNAILWYPEPVCPDVGGFGFPGPGQGQRPGTAVWIKPAGGYLGALSHEVGHNYGLGDVYGDNINPNLYMIDCWLAYSYYTAEDGVANDIKSIMSWLIRDLEHSFFKGSEYQDLHDELRVGGSPSPALPPPKSALSVAGVLAFDDSVVSVDTGLTSAIVFSSPDPTSPYHLQLGDRAGVLSDHPFPLSRTTPLDLPPGQPRYGFTPITDFNRTFNVMVPLPAGTEWVQILHDDAVLWRMDRSERAPEVTVVFPNGGESFGANDVTVVEWNGDDDGSGILTYSVDYSPDGGTQWFPIADGVQVTSVTWNTALSPGSTEGRIRVTASDGFDVGHDESDGVFTVESKPPFSAIVMPTSGSTFLQWEPIPLRAAVVDPETRNLVFLWTVSGDGGTSTVSGESVLLDARGLPGTYDVVLRVREFGNRIPFAVHESAFEVLADSDRDGMSDAYEDEHNFDPSRWSDGRSDNDRDGLSNFYESLIGTDPRNRDTDGDGWWDNKERFYGSDPKDPDSRPDTVTETRVWKAYR